ncbi:MAG: tail fiber domain-containing protein, partial [Ferruginibacter sp.]
LFAAGFTRNILMILFVSVNFIYAQNVGIGTVSPTSKLHVFNNTASASTLGYFNLITTAPTGISYALKSDLNGNGAGTYYSLYGSAGNDGTGSTYGVYGQVSGSGSGYRVGTEGVAMGTSGDNYGTRGWAVGTGAFNNYGIFGAAYGATTNYAGYFQQGDVYMQNNLGIGVFIPTTKLDISGASTGQNAVLKLTQTSTGHGIRANIQSAAGASLGNPSAIVGDAISGNGVSGTATTGTGIYGYSTSGVGVFGASSSNSSLKGFCSGSGAAGEFINTGGGSSILANGSAQYNANFTNTVTSADYFGLKSSCYNTPFYGIGITASGGYIGIQVNADLAGTGSRFGITSSASGGASSNFGIKTTATGGGLSYGVYASAFSAATNYAGYFDGNVYTTGVYLPSDRKLKNDIEPLNNALSIIQKLIPAAYSYKTNEYQQMHLPDGKQYGLIADEVQEVIPGAVTKAIQPAEYEGQNEKGKKIRDAVEFNAVNYIAMIPILIAAVKDQQTIINNQQNKIDDLEKRLSVVEKK